MKTIKVRGLVLHTYDAGENNKRLLIFCKGHGRMLVHARGAYKPTSKFMAASQPFTYADFVLAQGAGFYSLTQADIIESFYNLRTDYDRLIIAYKLAEACRKTLWDSLEGDEILRLLLKSLLVLTKGKLPPHQVLWVFLFRFLDAFGLRPHTETCIACGAPFSGSAYVCAEGLVCHMHKSAGNCQLSKDAVMLLQYVIDCNLSQAFTIAASPQATHELVRAAGTLWLHNFDWQI